jgi:hypothetical protein
MPRFIIITIIIAIIIAIILIIIIIISIIIMFCAIAQHAVPAMGHPHAATATQAKVCACIWDVAVYEFVFVLG